MAKAKSQSHKYNRIKEVLDQKALSQTWLAEKLDLDFQTVTRYVNNRRQPSIPILFAIAKALNVDVKDLLVSNR